MFMSPTSQIWLDSHHFLSPEIHSEPVTTGYSLQTLRDPGVAFGHLLHWLVKAPYDDHLVGMYKNPSKFLWDKLPTSNGCLNHQKYTAYCILQALL